MKEKSKTLSEEEIDEIVIKQADDDSAWESPVFVHRERALSLIITSELAERAAFFARLHNESDTGNWLRRIIQERLDIEEAIFTELKRDLNEKNSRLVRFPEKPR